MTSSGGEQAAPSIPGDDDGLEVLVIPTSVGEARVHLRGAPDPRGVMLLGHGAGGGVAAPDLQVGSRVALSLGWAVALVEQPYRVAGRRAPAPARQLDAAWTEIVTVVAERFVGLPLVVGGRSSGARVACRTATAAGAVAVLCLAFPLQTPRRPDRPSRLPELEAVEVPVLVVQGERDAFGMPPEGPGRRVVVVPGDHSLKKDDPEIATAISRWLGALDLTSSPERKPDE
ncbi:alpha/beta hydrolase family protein [Georgenia sunbinii]|uniref:alpha/beta hydrolase family protein n=1 Tax=Georgenia sunbinii TaxID=3117728 RepID=UPI002F267C66